MYVYTFVPKKGFGQLACLPAEKRITFCSCAPKVTDPQLPKYFYKYSPRVACAASKLPGIPIGIPMAAQVFL